MAKMTADNCRSLFVWDDFTQPVVLSQWIKYKQPKWSNGGGDEWEQQDLPGKTAEVELVLKKGIEHEDGQ